MTRQEAIQKIQNDLKLHHDYLSSDYRKSLRMAIEALQQPEIIRCKNCRYWKQLKSYTTKGICNAWYGKERSSTDYCSEGRRKEGETDG